MRLERWLHEWDTALLIALIGLLTGLIVFMAFDQHPAGCHRFLTGRPALAWVCAHP